MITHGNGRITIKDPFISLRIKKAKGAKLIINGNLKVISHLDISSPITITLHSNSILQIDGDFILGNGVSIFIAGFGKLYIGGKSQESESGITCDTSILVYKQVSIGKDFLCAWNVFITDSDWHSIEGQNHQADVMISDHVWIAHSTSILKGTNIGTGCIVASHSKLINKEFLPNSLIGGTPARILKSPVKWSRDIKE